MIKKAVNFDVLARYIGRNTIVIIRQYTSRYEASFEVFCRRQVILTIQYI